MPTRHESSPDHTDSMALALLDSVIPFLWRLGTVVAGLVAVAVGFLYVKQDSLLYFPEIGGVPRRPRQNPRRYRSPREHDLPHESHKIRCSDGVSIHAWLVLQNEPTNAPTLLFFHGNAGNIGLRLPNVLQMYHNLKCNILMVEYRGYGDSDSVTPNEAGLKLDAEAALRFAHDHALLDSNHIFLFGRSLGGAVAFHLAQYAEQPMHNVPIAGIIVENTFLSISHMVDHLMPLVAPLKGLVLRIGWNSIQIAPTLKTPILYLAGAQDQLVPHQHMLELYQLSRQAPSRLAQLHVVENGTHNETWLQGGTKYWKSVLQFLEKVKMLQQPLQQPNSEGTGEVTTGRSSGSNLLDPPMTGKETSSTIQMGDASLLVHSTSTASGSIPLMPLGLMNLAKEAASRTTSTVPSKKKE